MRPVPSAAVRRSTVCVNMMVNMMREHTTMDTRIHYVITSGGAAPNVVRDFAEVFYYVRHSEADEVRALWPRSKRQRRAPQWARVRRSIGKSSRQQERSLESLQMMMDEKLRQLAPIEYTAEERAWAASIRESFGDEAPPLAQSSGWRTMPY